MSDCLVVRYTMENQIESENEIKIIKIKNTQEKS